MYLFILMNAHAVILDTIRVKPSVMTDGYSDDGFEIDDGEEEEEEVLCLFVFLECDIHICV